jgi:SAM-dependent methyltransferase
MSHQRPTVSSLQARHHPNLQVGEFKMMTDYIVSLMHRKAYQVAAEQVSGSVLDLGCNTGYGTAIMRAATCARVVGVDVSLRGIREGRARFGGDYVLADAAALPFSSGEFDTVTSMQVIEHIDKLEPYLEEIRRVLTRRGKAFISTPNAAVRLAPGQRPWNRFHMREFTADDLQAALMPQFGRVEILGLRGTPELEGIETSRVARLRNVGRARSYVSRFMPLAFENCVVRLSKSLRRSVRRALTEDELHRFSLEHLRYEHSDFDCALDLLAVCSN